MLFLGAGSHLSSAQQPLAPHSYHIRQHRCRTFISSPQVPADGAVLQEFPKSLVLAKAARCRPNHTLSSKDLQDTQHSFLDLHNKISQMV